VNQEVTSHDYTGVEERGRAISTTQLLGQVMFLVAVALAVFTLGAFVGQDLSNGVAMMCSFAGLGMLLVQSFGGTRFRVGTFAIGWLYALALLIGLGVGPALNSYIQFDPGTVAQAAAGTALTVLGMAAAGFALSKDLARWMRPLSLIVLVAVVISIAGLVFGGVGGLSPILSLVIFGASALLIAVDFNYLRKHGTEDDTVWLATGIFVSIINIFISLLNLLGND
jgi:modulator of FtsH protease